MCTAACVEEHACTARFVICDTCIILIQCAVTRSILAHEFSELSEELMLTGSGGEECHVDGHDEEHHEEGEEEGEEERDHEEGTGELIPAHSNRH